MAELTREEKIKIFEKLPKELQNLMESEDTGAFLLRLGEKYNLDDDKISLLSKLIGDIILGITPVTSLAQEINSKVISDHQAAMNLAQELYTELLSPVIMEAKPIPTPMAGTPTSPQANVGAPAPQITAIPSKQTSQTVSPVSPIQVPSSKFPVSAEATTGRQVPSIDQYREPTAEGPAPQLPGPEIVDLRNQSKAGPPLAGTPPAVSKVEPPPTLPKASVGALPMAAAPIPPMPKPIAPLTFTKPIEPIKPPVQAPAPTNLIEAEPHLPVKISPEISVDKKEEVKIPEPPKPSSPSQISPRETLEGKPQFIIRPPGLAPTDLPHDVLDLRKDKGEF